jgi:RHS repeat-associated protein
VTVTLSNGTTWQSPTTIVSNVLWEPYGGMRSYQVSAGPAQPARLVEYLPGDNAASPGCPASRPSTNDATGRLRGLWVSSVGAAGDILKLTYTWQADQITATDTCLLGTTTPRTETFNYDATLRLTGAGRPTGNFAATGGAFSSRSYGYDGRSNRTSTVADAMTVTPSYATAQVDRLAGFSAGALYGYRFSYDAAGGATQKLGPVDSSGLPSSTTDYLSGPDGRGANDTVFRAVVVNGAAYNYFYDGLNRRRYKSYPTGTGDEYFYDLGHQLLVDQGNSSLTPSGATPVLDEYIWLGGRPVVLIRSNLTAAWAHQADGTGSCVRNNDPADCGVYFPVTDAIGKPVLVLSAAGRIAGTGEYDPFGHVNRVFIDAETTHPYGTTTGVFGAFAQGGGSPNLAVDVRVLVDLMDLQVQAADPVLCVNQPVAYDKLDLRDGAGTVLAQVYGNRQGLLQSPWVQPAGGSFQLAITNVGTCSFPPGPGGTCTTVCDGVASSRAKSGIVAGSYEYRRYEVGQNPFWTPLRFPGQYSDAETDLFENWNRYYDPATGRYLGAEPLLALSPTLVKLSAQEGGSLPAYSYSANNPVAFQDESGFATCQAKKGEKCDPIVRHLETPLRDRLVKRCAKEKEDNLKMCDENPVCQPPPKPDAGGDMQAYLAARKRAVAEMVQCKKSAECEYQACVAGATSEKGTTDYAIKWEKCMHGN